MLQTVQQNGHVFMCTDTERFNGEFATRYACGQTTNASSQTTAATWRRTNVCSIYSTTPLLTTTVSQLQQLWKTCSLLRRATRDDPDQWGPGLCSTSFELADDESIPTDEDGFCSYLDRLNPQWELVDLSDYDLT
jgi:hypothetical protein